LHGTFPPHHHHHHLQTCSRSLRCHW
jgi:hypothetical protein